LISAKCTLFTQNKFLNTVSFRGHNGHPTDHVLRD
jgi:hypothetical protein